MIWMHFVEATTLRGSSPPRRAFKSFNAQLVVDYSLHHMCQTQGLRALSGLPHGLREHMIVLNIKIYAALYRKLCIIVTQVSVSIWRSIYMQKWTLVCIWYGVFWIRGVGFFGLMTTAWFLYSQKNKADLIKCSTDGKTQYSPFSI